MVYCVISSELLILGTFMIVERGLNISTFSNRNFKENMSGLNMDLGENV